MCSCNNFNNNQLYPNSIGPQIPIVSPSMAPPSSQQSPNCICTQSNF